MVWFWDRVSNFFIALWIDTWTTLSNNIGSIESNAINWYSENVLKPYNDRLRDNIDEFADDMGIDRRRLEYLKKIVDFPFPLDVLIISGVSLFLMFTRGTAFINAASTKNQWEANQDVRPNLLSADHFAAYAFKNPNDWEKVRVFLTYLGLNDEQITILLKALQQIPQITSSYALLNRGIITESKFKNDLSKQGFSVSDADNLTQLRWFVPTISDLVLLAGRDQFEPETIEKFELHADLPETLVEWGEKAGYQREWIEKYWGAHWRVPSIQQAFEMVHRDVLDFEELDIFYDLADIAPFFRPRLEKIAFRVMSRVDVRRMQRLGVMDQQETFDAYRHMGYSPTDAKRMLDFTVAFNADQDKDLTKGEITKLYKRGVLTAYDFRQYLQTLKYSEDETFYINQLVDLEIEDDRIAAYIKATEQLYKQNDIDANEARAALLAEDVKADRIENYIFAWDNEKIIERRMPTKADVIRWFKRSIIGIDQFRLYFRQLGFIESDIDNYVAQIGASETETLQDDLIGT